MFCWWHLAQTIGPHQFLRPFMTFHIFFPKCQQVNLQKTRLIAHMNFLANSLSTFQLQGNCCKWAYYTHGPYCILHKPPKLPHESFVYSIQLFASRVVVDWWCQTRCASSCKIVFPTFIIKDWHHKNWKPSCASWFDPMPYVLIGS
jgi:hypothetical protein